MHPLGCRDQSGRGETAGRLAPRYDVEANRLPDRRRRGGTGAVLAIALAMAGCESYGVRSVDAKATPYHQRTVHAVLWNINHPEPLIVAEECGRAGISWVRADTNYLYWLAGVFTFGAWVPMTLYWRCAEDPAAR